MQKSKGKAKKYIKYALAKIVFPAPAKIKSDDFKHNFKVEYQGKKAIVSVQIVNKNLVTYDDSNLKKSFKNQAILAENILDAMIANYLGYNRLENV